MIRLFLILLSFLATESALAFSKLPNGEINFYCQSNQISQLEIQNVRGFLDLDYCKVTESEFPGSLKLLVSEIGELHRKTFALVKSIAKEDLFPIAITGGPTGPLSSDASQIGVFPDWNGEWIQPSIYVHELAHKISYRDPGLMGISANVAFAEPFADLIADEVLDIRSLTVEDLSLPECLTEIRSISSGRDQLILRDIDPRTDSSRYLTCCEKTKDLWPSSRHLKSLCQKITKNQPQAVSVFKVFSSTELDATPQPSQCYSDRHEFVCDGHLFSAWLDGFLLELKNGTGVSSVNRLIELSNRPEGRTEHLSCPKVSFKDVVPSYSSAGDILRALRTTVRPDQLAGFDYLWKKYSMDFFTGVDDLGEKEYIAALRAHHVLCKDVINSQK